MISTRTKRKIIIGLYIAFLIISVYFCVRVTLFITANYPWYDKIFALALLLAETFVLIHTTGYFIDILRVVVDESSEKEQDVPLEKYPPVAVVVASYKEPLAVLRDTLICLYNLSYPNKHLYLLDDTRYELPWDSEENREKYRHNVEELCKELEVNLFRSKWHGAKAGKVNDFLEYLEGREPAGMQLFHFDKKTKTESEKYMLVFDADMNPLPDFLEDLVSKMERHPNSAFIQTPQYYTNFQTNRVACAAGLQQAIFYEYICEGKGLQEAMFCCGTNVLFRRTALMDVGGFDETSVTEDFATSLKLHLKGWKSMYANRVAAFGLGPEDLGGYFKQQYRWARGTLGILMKLPWQMLRNFNKLPLNVWWEYWLPCTHYLVGTVFFIMVLGPVTFLFLDVPGYFITPVVYLMTYLPYFMITALIFFYTLRIRNYRVLDLATAILINAVAAPVYMKAALSALLGLRTSFGITPKGGSTMLSLSSLLPQLSLALLCMAAFGWGLMRIYYEREPFYALLINTFWCFCNFCFLSFTLYFNHSEESQE
jgi:cellulose synthase (UDP-forming)